MIKKITFSICALVLIANGSIWIRPVCYKTKFQISGEPLVGEDFSLILSIIASDTLPGTIIDLVLPSEGMVLTDGQQQLPIIRDFLPGDSIDIIFDLRIDRQGAYQIAAKVSPSILDSVHWQEIANFFVASYDDMVVWSDTGLLDYIFNLPGDDSPQDQYVYSVQVTGTVRYQKKNEQNNWLNANKIKMGLVKNGRLDGRVWYTNSDGTYNQTFDIGNGTYEIIVFSENPVGEVHGFLGFPSIYLLATHEFQVNGNHSEYKNFDIWGNPDGWYKQDICQILENIRKSNEWTDNHLEITHDYVNVTHPVPGWLPGAGTFYLPPFYFGPGIFIIPGSDQIYIASRSDIWFSSGQPTTSHEWAHCFMIKAFGGKVPRGWIDFSIACGGNHSLGTVASWGPFNFTGFSFSEGFAEFLGPAIWVDEFGENVDEGTRSIEDYYAFNNSNNPWWKGENLNNTDGTLVEGAVMSFIWDLFDDTQTNDHSLGIDDDGLWNRCSQIGQTLTKIKNEVHRDWLPCGAILAALLRLLGIHIPGLDWIWIGVANIDINTFKTKWDFDNIDELYNVNLFGTKPNAPDNLQSGYVTHNCVPLRWTDHAHNEGQYLIYRQRQYQNWELISVSPRVLGSVYTGYYDDNNVEPAIIYFYRVQALTCDSSNFSNTIWVRTKYSLVSNLVTSPGYESMKLNWDKLSINDGTLIVRSTNGPVNWEPTDGEHYSVGYQVSGGDVVHSDNHDHSETPFVDEGLTNGTTYYYKVFAYNENHIYSRGEVVPGTAGGIVISRFNRMTAYNNTSRIASGGGKLHLVTVDTLDDGWAADTMVVYTYSTNNGMTWSKQERVPSSGGDYGRTNFPALALNTQNIPYVLFGQYNLHNLAYRIHGYIRHRDENGWHYDEDSDHVVLDAGGSPGIPIAVPPLSLFMHGDTAYLAMVNNEAYGVLQCWKYHEDFSPERFIRLQDGPNYYWYDPYPYFSLPAILLDSERRIIVTYIHNGQIYLRYKNPPPYPPPPNPNWSDPIPVPEYAPRPPGDSLNYSIVANGTDLYIAIGTLDSVLVWKGVRQGGQYSWQREFYRTIDGRYLLRSSSPVFVDKGNYLVWVDPPGILYYNRRNGSNWGEPMELSIVYEYWSDFPQACISRKSGNKWLFIAWTEQDNSLPPWYWINSGKVKLPEWSVPFDQATGPSNAQLLTLDSKTGNIHMVFNTGSTIDYTKSTDEGVTWDDVVEVDSGSYPSIALDTSGLPRITYLKNDTVFCQILKPDSTWDTIVIFGGNESWKPKQPAVAPSYPSELANYSYSTFSTKDPMSDNSRINFSVFDVTEDIAPQPNEVASGESLKSPSIAITPGDYVHIVWEQKGEIYYRTSLQPI
ncbi:MAG: fibronectin type III domain-containing protein, partial [candidate division WOR-3 bacterium]|nr:fibronectin type III domain-containing protein [candidate division WOR-3 bacterium]